VPFWVCELAQNIRANANNKHALSLLRDAVVLGVQNLVLNLITAIVFKQLHDVLEGVTTVMTKETLHVLHHENLRFALNNQSIEVYNQLSARILKSASLSSLRKCLTRDSTR